MEGFLGCITNGYFLKCNGGDPAFINGDPQGCELEYGSPKCREHLKKPNVRLGYEIKG